MTSTAPSTKRLESSTPSETAIRWPTTELLLRRGRPRAALDVAPPGRLGPRAVRAGVLPRDDPRGPAPPQDVLEEGQEAAGTGRSGAATSVHRAAPRCSGRRSTRPASAGLSR